MNSDSFEIRLSENVWYTLPQTHFRQATDGTILPQETIVRVKRSDDSLTVAFECREDPYWQQTTHTEHNASLWEQEVFEVFISAGAGTPSRYLELELNPRNALFVGWIDNPTGEGDANTLTMVPYEEAGITHHITGTTANSWRGELRIPLALINSGQPEGTLPTLYRINFYRIILLTAQNDPRWTCNPGNASFGCWSPTLSGKSPRFHRPERFGTLIFQ
ncbi:carbohydrate-binding family 9-like protein [Salmonirosea aquatica]